MKLKQQYINYISALGDPLLLVISFIVAREVVFIKEVPSNDYFLVPLLGFTVIWFLICFSLNLYDNSKDIHLHLVISKNTIGLFIFSLASAGFIFLITDYKYSRSYLIYVLLFHGVLILFWRSITFLLEKNQRRKGKFTKKVVVLGYDNKIEKLIETVYHNPLFGFRVDAVFCDSLKAIQPEDNQIKKAKLNDALTYIENNKIDLILIALDSTHTQFIKEILAYADNNLIRIQMIPEFSNHFSRRFAINYYNRIPVLNLRNEPLKEQSNRLLKRAMDITFSLLTIIFAFPVFFPIIIIAIKLTSKGPVFFVQKRTGLEGKVFNCYKFRTMEVNKQSDSLQTVKDDKRITKIGGILRRTSIDEFPQVFNILMNQMSYVGPRPHMLKHTEQYKDQVNQFMVRHYVKPGLTGWAQINGYRGETKELIEMKNRAEADIWYIENWNFVLDIKIIYETIYMVLFKKENKAY